MAISTNRNRPLNPLSLSRRPGNDNEMNEENEAAICLHCFPYDFWLGKPDAARLASKYKHSQQQVVPQFASNWFRIAVPISFVTQKEALTFGWSCALLLTDYAAMELKMENGELTEPKYRKTMAASQRQVRKGKVGKRALSQIKFQEQHWWQKQPWKSAFANAAVTDIDTQKAAIIYEAYRRRPEVQQAWQVRQAMDQTADLPGVAAWAPPLSLLAEDYPPADAWPRSGIGL
jgi:hypothetical protein